MASKVNTKFVLILATVVVFAGMTIGGMAFLNARNNIERNLKRADEALARGELKAAFEYYGRAAYKQPGNLMILGKLEEVLLRMTAITAEEAHTRYIARINILKQAARHNGSDAETHLKLLRELYTSGRLYPHGNTWFDWLGTSADDMWTGLADVDPKRPFAKSYRAMSKFRLASQRTTDELHEAQRDAQEAVDAMPDNDFAWSTLCLGQIAIADKYRGDGRSRTAIDDQLRLADQNLAKAVESVPNGPETAYAVLLRLNQKRSEDERSVSDAELQRAADRLMTLVGPDSDPGLISDASDLLSQTPTEGPQRAVEVLHQYLEKNPNAVDKRWRMARLQLYLNELDSAEDQARKVLDSEPLTTSFLAQIQFGLKQEAAALLVDVENRRWLNANAENKPKHLAAMESARAVLAGVVKDQGNDPLLMRADGKIAYAKKQYDVAAAHFEKLHRVSGEFGLDLETLLYSAECLERLGQLGLAHDRLAQLVRSAPGNPEWITAKANLEYRMGRMEDALKTIAMLPESELSKPEMERFIAEVKRRKDGGAPVAPDDPVQLAISQASAAMIKGEIETARSTLLAAAKDNSENLQLLQAMAQLEIRDGKNEKAREYVDAALRTHPNDLILLRMDSVLKNEDPVDAVREYSAVAYSDEFERSLSLATSLSGICKQQTALATDAERRGDAAAAGKAKSIAERAAAEAKAQEKRAAELRPDDRDLLEYQFQVAIDAKDWTAAEELVIKARTLNADQAEGAYFKGRLDLVRGNLKEAVRALETASDRLSYSALVWRALGFAYEGLGNDVQSLRAYEQGYKCNPNDVEGAKLYIKTLLKRNESQRALAVSQTLRQLVPGDGEVRHLWLELESLAGSKAVAIRNRRASYKENPNDPSNGLRLAQLLGELEPGFETALDQDGKPLFTDTRWSNMGADEKEKAIVSLRSQWRAESDAILESLLNSNDADLVASAQRNVQPAQWKLMAASIKAHLLRERGQSVEGEQFLDRFISAQADQSMRAEMLIELGRFQARSSHYTEAFATLEKALEFQDPELMQVDQEIAGLAMQLNVHDKALAHVEKLLAAKPDNPLFIKQKAECLMKVGKFDESEQLLTALTKANGEDYVSTMLLASISQGRAEQLLAAGDAAGAQRKFAEQREALARAEQQEPSSFKPRILLAQSQLAEYRRSKEAGILDEAMKTLERAEKVQPGVPEVALMRVALLREKVIASVRDRRDDEYRRKLTPVIAELRAFVTRNPDHVVARRDLVQMMLDVRDVDGALSTIDEAIKSNPTLALWHEAKGDVYLQAKRDSASAYACYARADEYAPRTITLVKMVESAFMSPSPNCAELVNRLGSRASEMSDVPVLREGYAKALACVGKRDLAIEQAKLSYANRRELIKQGKAKPTDISPWYELLAVLFPGNGGLQRVDASAAEQFAMDLSAQAPDVYELIALAGTWVLSGDPSATRAIELQRKALKEAAADDKELRIKITLGLANYLLLANQNAEAADAYIGLLDLDSNNIEALNNLAYVMAEALGKPKEALPFAERALQLVPENPSILDTLGWTHHLAGNNEKARQYLEESLKLDSRGLSTILHLAELSMAENRIDEAQRLLDQAVKLNPDPASAQKMDKLKDDIRKRRTTGG